MKQLLKIAVWGSLVWSLTLPWLEFNRFLLSPVVLGLLVGTWPAYLLGQWFGRRRKTVSSVLMRSQEAVIPPVSADREKTRPTPPHAEPTRPSPAMRLASCGTRPMPHNSMQNRANRPTTPMPILIR